MNIHSFQSLYIPIYNTFHISFAKKKIHVLFCIFCTLTIIYGINKNRLFFIAAIMHTIQNS